MKITYQKADAGGKSILAVHDSRESVMGWEATVIRPFASARGETLDDAVKAVLAIRGSGVCPDWHDKKYRGLSAGAPYPGHLPLPSKVVAEAPAPVEAPAPEPAKPEPVVAAAPEPEAQPEAAAEEPAPAQPES